MDSNVNEIQITPIQPQQNQHNNSDSHYVAVQETHEDANIISESRKFCSWTVQILLWICLVWIIMCRLFIDNFHITYLPFIIVYTVYLVWNFCCSETIQYLLNTSVSNTIYQLMESLFYTPARIIFKLQGYHNEIRKTSTNVNGKNNTKTETVRVNTYSETMNFKYMSWRDVSGKFELNISDFKRDPNKALVKLKLTLEVELAKDGTQTDFDAQKEYFISKNRNKDQFYDFNQIETLDGLHLYNLVKLSDSGNTNISLCYFIISTFFCFAELYKKYLNKFCLKQSFIIRKLYSTKQNLNLADNFKPHLKRSPTIIINEKVVTYDDPSKLGVVSLVPELPNLEEITNYNKDGETGEKHIEYPTFDRVNNIGKENKIKDNTEHNNVDDDQKQPLLEK